MQRLRRSHPDGFADREPDADADHGGHHQVGNAEGTKVSGCR